MEPQQLITGDAQEAVGIVVTEVLLGGDRQAANILQ
jgi:hypothetical protein